MKLLLDLWNSGDFTSSRVRSLMGEAYASPQPLPTKVVDLFCKVSAYRCAPRDPLHLEWQRTFCHNRYQMSGVAFGCSLNEGSTWYVFLFGVLSPLEAWFVRSSVCSLPIPVYSALSEMSDRSSETSISRFACRLILPST